jgi:membrane protease YdiL (CAAX protease family)
MIRWGWLAAASAFLGIVAAGVGVAWQGYVPFFHPDPWLKLDRGVRDGYSAVLGLAIGGLIVVLTRAMVSRWKWAQRLHGELRPLARGINGVGIVVLALLSSIGEELLFRGLLTPAIGIVPQALIFGFAHQIPGRSRWAWATWATLVGLILGAMFRLTGSLVGPLAAHALINALNLSYLKRHDPKPPRRGLGGLLGQRG